MMSRKKIQNPIQGVQVELDLLGSRSAAKPDDCSLTNSERWIEYKWIRRGSKLCGPYLYQRWREGNKQRSKYLGKALTQTDLPACHQRAQCSSPSSP